MRAVVQRVARAAVRVDGVVVGEIEDGVLVLVGVGPDDRTDDAAWLADKVANLRIFPDDDGKMNRSLLEVAGSALVVSQFTLFGDARKGRRPSFARAAEGPDAERLVHAVVVELRAAGVPTETGSFGAMMDVELVNRGPVTILLDSKKLF